MKLSRVLYEVAADNLVPSFGHCSNFGIETKRETKIGID